MNSISITKAYNNALMFRCSEQTVFLKALFLHCQAQNITPSVIIDFPEHREMIEGYFKKITFISWNDSVRLVNSPVFKHGYKRLKSDILTFSKSYLDSAVDIINRFKLRGQFSKNETASIYYASFDNSLDLLITNEIGVIYFHDIPHHIDSFTLYVAAKYLGIKTIMFSPIYFGQIRMSIDTSIDNRGWTIKQMISIGCEADDQHKKLREKMEMEESYVPPVYMFYTPKRKNIVLRGLASVFETNSIPFLMLLDLYRYTQWGLFKRHPYSLSWNSKPFHLQKHPINLVQLMIALYVKLKVRKICKYYQKKAANSLPQKFVLFAPNYQPEATTQPSARHFSSIITCLRLLRGKLPNDVIIVYKEHNSVFDLRNEAYVERDELFYNQILEIDNLIIAPTNISTLELIQKSLFVITQTSSIALEAVIKNKMAVVFGSVWFDEMRNIFKWTDVESAKDLMSIGELANLKNNSDLIDNIAKYTFKIDDDELEINSKNAAELLNRVYTAIMAPNFKTD